MPREVIQALVDPEVKREVERIAAESRPSRSVSSVAHELIVAGLEARRDG